MSGFDLAIVSARLRRDAIQWDTHFIASCDSTQGLARSAIEAGAGSGWLTITDFQARGRGRQDRTWDAPPGRAVLFSALLTSPVPTFSLVPLLAGLAVGQGIEDATGLVTELKWPNDLLAGGRKLAGILCERPGGQLVIVGVGVNVNQSPEELSPEPPANSIASALGHPVSREAVLIAMLNAFDAKWQRAASEGSAWIVSAWRSRSPMLGRAVTFKLGSTQHSGVAEDIGVDGALVIRAADGRLITVSAGDVHEVRTPAGQS